MKGNRGLFSQFLCGLKSCLERGKKKIRPLSPSGILYLRQGKRSGASAAVILLGLSLYIGPWIAVIRLLVKIISLCMVHILHRYVLRCIMAEFCFPLCHSKPKAVQLD